MQISDSVPLGFFLSREQAGQTRGECVCGSWNHSGKWVCAIELVCVISENSGVCWGACEQGVGLICLSGFCVWRWIFCFLAELQGCSWVLRTNSMSGCGLNAPAPPSLLIPCSHVQNQAPLQRGMGSDGYLSVQTSFIFFQIPHSYCYLKGKEFSWHILEKLSKKF